jgi:hypothetical protein
MKPYKPYDKADFFRYLDLYISVATKMNPVVHEKYDGLWKIQAQ